MKWKLIACVFVAACLTITQLELSALAAQAPAPAARPAQTSDGPSKGRLFKRILLGIAATGAVVATIVLLRNDKQPEPVVTVGAPTVGSPQ